MARDIALATGASNLVARDSTPATNADSPVAGDSSPPTCDGGLMANDSTPQLMLTIQCSKTPLCQSVLMVQWQEMPHQ